VRVSIAFRGTRLRVSVRDDGGGMSPATAPEYAAAHLGLVGMREHASSVGAELRISSVPGRGTNVRLQVPLLGERPIRDALRQDRSG